MKTWDEMPKTMLKKVEFSSSMYVGLEGSTKGKEINQQDVATAQ